MKKIFMLLFGAAGLSTPFSAQEKTDSILSAWEKEFELKEVVVVASRPVLKQAPDRIIYMTKNDPYSLGLNGVQVLLSNTMRRLPLSISALREAFPTHFSANSDSVMNTRMSGEGRCLTICVMTIVTAICSPRSTSAGTRRKRGDFPFPLLDNRLNLAFAVNDPFGWNITRSTARYKDYVVDSRNNIHSHAVTFRASWSFGRNKVNHVYRDTKEKESRRTY